MAQADYPFQDIGRRLDALRVAMGKRSQKEWACLHGFNATQLNNWLKGARRIPVEHAETLCDAYGVTLDWIYRGRRDGLSENARNVL
jgi:transcriptional regulator with XRE-family HTH domain